MSTAVRGRPRDPRVDEQVTVSLVRLLAERGPDRFSVDDLAEEAGVSKATIYRRYRTRDQMVVAGLAASNESMPDLSDLPLRPALVAFLSWLAGAVAAGMTPSWLIGMQQRPELEKLYREQVVNPRRAALRRILERAVAAGELSPDSNLEAVSMLMIAPALHLGMHRARGCGYPEVSIEELVDCTLGGVLSPAARATGS